MDLHVIDTGYFKLDGGAMFGVVPKSVWKKLNPPDEKNLCTWAMRCLLVVEGDRTFLIDTGIGDKQDGKFLTYFEPHGEDSLEKSLNAKGFSLADITDVVLTHLHFDHCGGAVSKNKNGVLHPTFPNATYWTHETHWRSAMYPNVREKASFLTENIMPLEESGQLKFIGDGQMLCPGFWVESVSGHTDSMLIPHILYGEQLIMYMADLIPSAGHIPLPYIMSYDMQPLLTLKEKSLYLERAYHQDAVLFFEHDPKIQCCNLEATSKGYRLNQSFDLEVIL